MEIEYFEILKKGWRLTWKNRFLWWFGFFVTLASLGSSFNYSFDSEQKSNGASSASQWMVDNMYVVFILAGIAVLVFIAITIFGLIAKAGLIHSIGQLDKNKPTSFKEGFRRGRNFFWRLVGLSLIVGLVILASLLILATPIILCFVQKIVALGILLIIVALVIFIPLVVTAAFTAFLGQYYIVTSDLKVFDAIEKSYLLFKNNIWKNILMALMFILVKFVLFLALFSVLLILLLPFGALAAILYYTVGLTGMIVAASVGGLLFIASALFLSSIYQVLLYSSWYYFFKEIASWKKDEKVEETIEDPIADKVPAPEKV